MSAGTVIDVRPHFPRNGRDEGTLIEVARGDDLQARYDRLLGQVMRTGSWLNGPHAQLLSLEAWEEQFARYQQDLERLRRLAEELRPTTLRDRQEMLAGEALVSEVTELFAA
jgi:hypothetical protein